MRSPGLLTPCLAAALVCALGCAQSPPPPAQNPAAATAAAPTKSAPAVAAPPLGAPLRLFPANEARPLLLASISMPSLDRTLSGGVALVSRAVPLPLDAAGVKEALLTQAGLPAQVGQNLDTASPAGIAVIATGGKEVAGLVMAIPAKGVEQARVVINALGSVVGRRGEVMQIDNGTGGRGWVWQSAQVIVLSDSVDALGRGAMLALEARRSGAGEDLTGIIYPEAIARAYGTNVKTALNTMVAMARMARAAQLLEAEKAGAASKSGKGGGKASKVGGKPAAADTGAAGAGVPGVDHSLDMLEDIAGYAADTGTIEIGLSITEGHGLIANLRVHPLPGTPLERLTADARPFAIDPVLLRRSDDAVMLGASSYGPFLKAQIARQRQRLLDGHDKGAAAAVQFMDTATDAFEGSWSGIGWLQPALSAQVIYPLKDAASAAKLSAALAHFDTAASLAFLNVQLPADQRRWIDIKLKKETVGKLKTLHYSLSFDGKATPAATRDAVKKVFGGTTMEVYAGVAGTRALVVMGVGKEARSKMADLARAVGDARAPVTGAPVAEADGDLTDAVVGAKGKDSLVYVDLGRFVGLVASMSEEPRAKALAAGARAPLPTYVTFASDASAKQMTFSWTVPPAAFAGAGAILQSLSLSGASK
ncbi:MAG TPA: hypothetical protein VFH68_11545 [Polyangia bacterium]|jgi:hypothetical protein|nr:hypothetical protein [Polyangia bacterium]